MKKTILLTLLVGLTLKANACVNKIPEEAKEITCIVMDSAQSLIGDAIVTFSDRTDTNRTRWDGLIRFTPLAQRVRVHITKEGYKDCTFTIDVADKDLVRTLVLYPLPNRNKDPYLTHRTGGKVVASTYAKAMIADKAEGAVIMEEAVAVDDIAYREFAPADGAANVPAAGQLTAGEVNDFARWGFWKTVLHETHQGFIADWNLHAEHRYLAQVTNQNGFPLSNIQVSLVDSKGLTLFQTRTDNTGRAELWNGLLGESPVGEVYIRVANQRQKAILFEDGVNIFRFDEICTTSEEADVFFILDATGSMGDEMHYLQAELKDVINRSQQAVDGLQMRTGALVYRDHNDEYVTRISRLANDIEVTQQFLDCQHASGGGDYEEAIPEALMATLNTAGWNDEARARIAFLILDAPCHKDSMTLTLLHEQILNAAAMGVRLVPVVCSGMQGGGELLLRQIALATNGTSFFLTDDSGIGNEHLKPTTDSLKVEHLNDMLVRTIIEFSSVPQCADASTILTDDIEPFLPMPTPDVSNLTQPIITATDVMEVYPNPCPIQCTVVLKQDVKNLFLIDITGKMLRCLGALPIGEYTISTEDLSTGVYFLTAYCQGRWVSVKILV